MIPLLGGADESRIAEHGCLFAEAEIGRDNDAGALIELAQQMEEQGPAGGAERQIAKLVEDDEIGVGEPGGDLSWFGHCQSKIYTAFWQLRGVWVATVFADESRTARPRFDAKNRLYLFALTVPKKLAPLIGTRSVADSTIGERLRISRFDEGSARCSGFEV
jgi:hypothetical protein